MRIYFFAGKCIPFHAHSLAERPLGGTETGVLRCAEILQARGHDVTVFTTYPEPPPSRPEYRPAAAIAQAPPCDVLISVQDWWGVFLPVTAQRRFYWTGDGAEQYMNFGLGDRRVVQRIDRFLAVSNWQARHICEESGFPPAKVSVIRNGVHLPWFAGSAERRRGRLIYTATPYRGLQLVPPLYREIKKQHPEIELHIFSGLAVYDKAGPFQGPLREQYEQLKAELAGLPDCVIHGNVRQAELARECMQAGMLFYPNIFRETSCITALEALAAGCPVLTSAYGALPETVADAGFLIGGNPGSPEYSQAFVAAADRLLTDDALWTRMSQSARARICKEYSWEHTVDRLEAVLAGRGGS